MPKYSILLSLALAACTSEDWEQALGDFLGNSLSELMMESDARDEARANCAGWGGGQAFDVCVDEEFRRIYDKKQMEQP